MVYDILLIESKEINNGVQNELNIKEKSVINSQSSLIFYK